MLVGDPVISEFQASNVSTLADEDQEFPDWIEIHNPDTSAVSLDGWYLTDDASDLRKWQFPAGTSLGAGNYMTVFASGKNRTSSGQPLHTDFRLSAGGEYLALVKPDGQTVVQAFDYPEQVEDTSYGLAVGREVTELMTEMHPVRAFVPTDDRLGVSWIEDGFDDSGWLSGTTGVGYEVLQSGFTERLEFDQPLGAEWTIDNPGASTVTQTDGALVMNVPTGIDTTSDERGTAPIVHRDIPPFPGAPSKTPTTWQITTHVTQGGSDRGAAGIMIYDGSSQKPVVKFQYSARLRFELRVNEDRKASDTDGSEDVYFLRLERDGLAKTWTASYKKAPEDDWIEVGKVTDGVDDVPVIADPKPALFATSSSSTMNARFDFVDISVPDEPSAYGAFMNLDVGADLRGNNGSIYMRMPFDVAGDPARFDELNLALRFDDGYRAYLNGELVSEFNAPLPAPPPAPNVLPWNANAAGTHGAESGHIPVTFVDLSEFKDTLKSGRNLLAVQGLNIESDDVDFFFDAQLLGSEVVSGKQQAFTNPTPGSANLTPAAAAPIVVGQEGVFFDSTIVELKMAEPSPSLEIRYTTDGSEPTRDSILYSGPLVLTESAMLQARVFDSSEDPTFDPSPMTAATFIAAAESLRDRSSDIPLVILDTMRERIPGSGATNLTPVNVIAIETSRATGRATLDNPIVDYLGRGGVRDRGSSTAGQAKPNMTFETWGPDGRTEDDDENAGLLGFASESDWVLHAPFNFDRALVRNQFAYGLSNQIGQWAPKTRAIEVYLNRTDGVVTEEDYMGVYVLVEKITEGPGRLNLAEIERDHNEEPEVSGGYIWKIDRTDPDAGTFGGGGLNLNWVHPKSPRSRTARDDQKATDEQQRWVIDHFTEAGNAVRRTSMNDPDGYTQFIDVASFVDHHLLSVFMDDVDAFALSAYLHKDRNDKIKAGPLWDFDRSMESLDDRDDDPTLWGGSGGSNFFDRAWYSSLFRDEGFWQAYVDRWSELRRTHFSIENLDALLNQLTGEVEESQERNFEARVNRGVRPRRSSRYESGKLDGTWEGEVEHMRKWLHDRVEFIDSMFTKTPRMTIDGNELGNVKGVRVSAEQEIEILGPQINFFDDVSFVSGEPGETVASYLIPVDDSLGTDWTQPDFDDSQWTTGTTGIGFDSTDADGVITGDFGPVITTPIPNPGDIQAGATTLLTRIPFDVADASVAHERDFVLRMKYDDGFVAYLNGTEILRHNLRDDELSWTSRANSRRSSRDSEIVEKFEDFDVSEFSSLLVDGRNVLAIRGINSSSTSGDMLVLPALVSREIRFGINPNAKVYYTTDGSDPRAPDGTVNPAAQVAEIGHKLSLDTNTRIIARALDEVTDRGREARNVRTDWGGPIQYDIAVTDAPLVISEVHYNPGEPSEAELQAGFNNDDFEFVEIHNPGDAAVSLVGIELTDGVAFDFIDSDVQSIEAGGYVVLASNADAFQMRYGTDLPLAGVYAGQLDNRGEDIDLVNAAGEILFSTNYGDNDPWPERADGVGASLELIRPADVPADQQSKWYRWRASRENGGSPGRAGNGPVGVVINEVLANTGGVANLTDSIELLNTSDQAIDLSGWHLSDSADDFAKFAIPAGTVLQPGQYLVLNEETFGFGLSGTRGDDIWLVQRSTDGRVENFVDDVHFDPTLNGESLGRVPDATGRLAPLQSPSLGSPNADPRVGPLVISEIQYNPVISDAALAVDANLDVGDLEFIEIYNPTAQTVDLTAWRLRGGVDLDFDDGLQLGPNEALVVISFNPEGPENGNRLGAFRAHYGIGQEVRLVGGYQGQLNNSDDRLVLRRPDSSFDDTSILVQEDEVLYDDQAPWPAGADGTGESLQRVAMNAFGNDASSWVAAPATPGRTLAAIPGDFNSDGRVAAADIDLLFEQLRSPTPDLSFDLNNDGTLDQADRDHMIQNLLRTDFGDANLDGVFNSRDLVQIFKLGLFEDDSPLNAGWESGDWNGDGEFDSQDLLIASQTGRFE